MASYSLKDQLFNEKKVQKISKEIASVYKDFDSETFIYRVISRFPELELKQRITWISEMLYEYLPKEYKKAVDILIQSLPPINDPKKTDGDFGDFIYAPYAEYVARYGCSREHLTYSLAALKEITQRFSVEDAIRYFINAFPEETMKYLFLWSQDAHYHVRRLTSEGTRPKLPWSQKIHISAEKALPILEHLFMDTTRFVTRSVANHLNDLSKTHPDLVIDTLTRWRHSGKQQKEEMEYIIRHALRTLVKQGYSKALSFLGIDHSMEVHIMGVSLSDDVRIGSSVDISFSLVSKQEGKCVVDYILWFQNKKGEMKSKKVYKHKTYMLKKDEPVDINISHMLRKGMTTRTIYPGAHKIQLQGNGNIIFEKLFEVLPEMPA